MQQRHRERINVDVKGLKAALSRQAAAQGLTLSVMVRELLETAVAPSPAVLTRQPIEPTSAPVRLSVRLTEQHAVSIRRAARAAGLSLGHFITWRCMASPEQAATAREGLEALLASNTLLASSARDVQRTTNRPLSEHTNDGLDPAALQALVAEIKAHLRIAAAVAAQLRQVSRIAVGPSAPESRT